MDYDKLDEILSTIDYKNKEYLSPIIDIIGQIKKCLIAEKTAYSHLMLREHYFGLIQKILEFENELMIKFSFNSLQRFLTDEVTCELCSTKEKSQFLANILRYIQHSHINNDITKLEIIRFLLNNHDTIEPILNPKILTSLIEISINEWQNDNKIIQSSSKALIIKYIAIVCNKISSYEKSNLQSQENPLDLLILCAFSSLLSVFNQEFRTNDLRVFALECLELLLNNLIQNKTFNICESQSFMEFSWQTLCPSILCQFGDIGLPSKALANHGLHFKLVYKILILMTALIGGCSLMIPVFEAIYQRVLLYTPEDDRLLILKLFKTHVNREFLESLVNPKDHNLKLNNVDVGNKSKGGEFNEFTIINLIIGFYRNSYEKSIKPPGDRMVQLLSSDCVSSFVQLVYNMYEEKEAEETPILLEANITFDHFIKYQISVLEDESHILETEADVFLGCLESWLSSLALKASNGEMNLDDEIKALCFDVIERSSDAFKDESIEQQQHEKKERFRKEFLLSKRKIYATIYMSIYLLFKSQPGLNENLHLSKFKFEQGNSRHCLYFIFRVMAHKDGDENHDFDRLFSEWLHCLYEKLQKFSVDKSDLFKSLVSKANILKQLKIVLEQIDCYSRAHQVHVKKSTKHCFVKSILKSSWIYLIDVLTGCLINIDLCDVEKILFYDQESQPSDNTKPELDVDNSDFSFVVFTLRSTLDSLFRLLKLVAGIDSMENELNQLFFILIDGNFFQSGLISSSSADELSLNKIICLDFVLYSSLSMVCDVTNLLESPKRSYYSGNYESNATVWKYLVDSAFYCLYLRNSLSDCCAQLDLIDPPDKLSKTANFFLKNKNLFKSVYANLNETIRDTTGQKTRLLSDSNLITSNEISLKIETIFTNIFYLIDNKKYYRQLSKSILIDQLAANVNDFLFNKLFAESNLLYLWNMSSTLCATSRRFLLNEKHLKQSYLTFNNLIIDMIEEFLGKLVEKLGLNLSDETIQNVSCLPNNELVFNLKPAKSSIYSIFFLEIWLHVYVVYFKSLFSRCGGLEKISKLAAKNKLAGKKLRNFSILDSIRSFNPVSNDKVVEQNTDVKFNRNNTLVDLYLFKKLICLIQKLFEIYTSRENGDFIETITSCMEIHNIQNGLIKTPSISSSNSSTTFLPIESDQQQQHDFNEPSQLIRQLEAYQTSLNDTTQQAERSRQISTCILYDSTLRLITPLPRFSSDLYRENLIDKFFSPNTFLLLPIKYLILNRKLDHSLKDETVNLISELVETSGSKLTTSWNFLFSCLRHLEFGGGSLEKSVQDKKRRAVKSRKSSSSSASPFSSSSSDNNSSDESDNANNSDNDLSTSSDEGKNLSFSPLSVRFSSIQTRMDSLVHIFNAYLNLASSSNLVLISGGVEFVKCVSTFVRNHHSTFKIEYNSENLFYEQFESHEANRERTGDSKEKELLEEIDDDSDLYMESNKSSGDQKSVTEVERLVELSKTQNPNSQIKPFLVCVQKMFRIILKHLTSLDISSKQSEVVQLNQLLIETNRFEVTLTEFSQAKKIPLAWLNEKINRLNFEAFGKHEFIEFETSEDLAILHANFEDFLKHKDGLNLNKLIIYSVDSLCESVFCTHNELNSVEIVELINDIIIKLVDLNQFHLVGYLLIQVVIKKLDREIDYYELIRSKSMVIINNGNYTSNLFFVSQLFSHRINSLIAIIEKIIDVLPKEDEQNIVILNTTLNRLFYIITKATIRKLDKFDSLIDLDFKFDNLFKKCFELGILSCKNVCINGIRTLYLLSLVPFNTLILNYQVGSDDNTIKYSNLEILTDECRNKWELSCVKKSFNWSKKLFSNEQFSDEPPPETSEVVETGNNRQPAQSDDEISINEESEENEGMNKHKDEKNFYRNFTIKLSSSQSKNLFCNENPSGKHINLNCLISFLKFHSATLNVVTNCCCSKSNLTASILKLLGVTYLTSIKIDRLFSFKILLSKILYLNYESNLANFISLTKLAFSTIGELLCEFACEQDESIVVGESSSIDVIESELDSLLKNEPFSLGKFFGLFISHFAKYYLYLNEKTHDFKLDDAYLKTLMDKYENDAGLSEIKREEVIELFRIHKEHNKTLTMKTLTKITQTTLSKSPSLALSEAEVSKEDNLNDLDYIRNDYRFRYQTWSFRMIRSFLNGLNDETRRNRGAIEKMPREARKCVAQVIVVFNSCSSYCHCSISAFNEELTDMGTSSKSDLKHVKDTSVNLLSSILNSLKRND